MTAAKKNIAASVHQRLKNLSEENGEDFNLLLVRFANERLLYRLSISEHNESFLLKGATLLSLWSGSPHRPTRDIDLLGFGSNNISDIEKTFRDICRIQVEDGLIFQAESVKGSEIKEGEEYQGVRIKFLALVGSARVNLQVDVGFGDAVTPEAQTIKFPTVLDFPAPDLKAYPKETVIAEKFEAMVKLGIANTRMKDFWDLRLMVSEFDFDGTTLQKAIEKTFKRRQTVFPENLPIALTKEFSGDKVKQMQWNAFLRKNKLDGAIDFESVVDVLRIFFQRIIDTSARNKKLDAQWRKSTWELNDY